MSKATAQAFLDPDASKGESATAGGYISSDDVKDAIGVIYADLGNVLDDPSSWALDALFGDTTTSVIDQVEGIANARVASDLDSALSQVMTGMGSKFADSSNWLNKGPAIESANVGVMDADDIQEIQLRVMEYLRDYTADLLNEIKVSVAAVL